MLFGQTDSTDVASAREEFTYKGLVLSPAEMLYSPTVGTFANSTLGVPWVPSEHFWVCVDTTLDYYKSIEQGIFISERHHMSQDNQWFNNSRQHELAFFIESNSSILKTIFPNDYRSRFLSSNVGHEIIENLMDVEPGEVWRNLTYEIYWNRGRFC